ncbi:EF-hand domain-containing protein, partial [Roseomonas aerophila]
MKRTLALGFFGAALSAAALPALAQPAPDRGPGRIQARIFDQADANKDGRVSEAEAVAFMTARFAEADANRDGGVTPEEMSQFVRAQFEANRPPPPAGRERREPPPRAVRAMEERQATIFRIMDANRDGRVTVEEMQPVVLAMFRAADTNGDGALERSELQRQHRGPGRPGGRPAPVTPAPDAPAPGAPAPGA